MSDHARPAAILRAILLSGASVMVVAGAATAADLPSRKAAPAAYVRICDAYGSGFFVLPGTDTCVRLGGYVRFEAEYVPGQKMINVATGAVSQVASAQDTTGMEVRGQLRLDARTPTAWGPARTYIQFRMTNASGIRAVSVPGNFGLAYNAATASTSPKMERAIVQWNGFTFGLMSSEWNTWPSGTNVSWIGDMPAGWSNGVMGVSYSYSLTNDLRAIVSVESRTDAAHDQNSIVVVPGLLGPTTSVSTIVNRPDTMANIFGVIDWQQSWGSFRGGAMVGNNSTTNGPTPFANAIVPTLGYKTYLGWAVNGTLQIKLPMISKGDEFWVNAAYGVGQLGYVTGDSWNSLTGDSPNKRVIGGVMVNPSNLLATAISPTGAPLGWTQSKSWEIMGLYSHYWAPQWRTHVEVGYVRVNNPTAVNPVGGLNTQLGNASVTVVKGNLIFSPTKDMDIGAEVGYGWLNAAIQNPTAAFVAAGQPGLKLGNWISKVRVQRLF